MNAPFKPTLTTTDWNEEWKQLQKSRNHADSSEYWDARAATFHQKDAPNSYVLGFIDHLELQEGDTLFDMGCGNGALTVPLASMGHRVISADFSQGMLDALDRSLTAKGLKKLVTSINMSWSDDWESQGITENCVDIAFASRSIATDDLRDSLMRLNRVARRRAAITLSTSMSPRIDEQILVDLGIQAQMGKDFLYAFNILAGEHFHPEVCYLKNNRHDRFDTLEEANASLERMHANILAATSERDHPTINANFTEWKAANLIKDEDEGGTFWHLAKPRRTSWAFISWDTAL